MHSELRPHKSEYSRDSRWSNFLQCWFEKVASLDLNTELDQSARAAFLRSNQSSFDSTPALESRLVETEKRLKDSLPHSYRQFMMASNGRGWYAYMDGFDKEINGARRTFYDLESIGPFGAIDPLGAATWSGADLRRPRDKEYYLYGPESGQSALAFDSGLLGKMIKIGGLAQGAVLLLNPFERSNDGELEAWVLSPAHGAVRYRSFAALIRETAFRDTNGSGGFLVPESLISKLSCASNIIAR